MLWLLGQFFPEYLCIERDDYGKNIPMTEQVKYKYLMDICGTGWTDRVKILLQLGRPLFLVDRPYKEWYFDKMQPMKHYVPVKADLSDLIEKIKYMEQNERVYNEIVQNTLSFSREYLIGQKTVEYLRDITLQNDVVPQTEKRDDMWLKEIYKNGSLFQD